MPSKEDAGPALRAGRYLTRSELALAAKGALEGGVGGSHAQAAADFGATHRTAITRAVDSDNPAGVDLCRSILERYAGYTFAEEPSFLVSRV